MSNFKFLMETLNQKLQESLTVLRTELTSPRIDTLKRLYQNIKSDLNRQKPLESNDSSGLFLSFSTFLSHSFLRFPSDPNPDPYGERAGNNYSAVERIKDIITKVNSVFSAGHGWIRWCA